MALDWGLYSALTVRDDFEGRREASKLQLQLGQYLHEREMGRERESQQAYHYTQQYLQQFQNVQVRPQDVDRVNDMIRGKADKVKKRLMGFNGDYRTFMLSGGYADLEKFKQSVLSSEEYNDAITNKASVHELRSMYDSGKIPRNATVELWDDTRESMNAGEAYKLYSDGRVKRLVSNGGFEPFKIDVKYFKENFSPDLPDGGSLYNRYEVTPQQVYSYVVNEGGTDEQAKYASSQYAYALQPEKGRGKGTPVYWKHLVETNLQRRVREGYEAKKAGVGAGAGKGVTLLNPFEDITFAEVERKGDKYDIYKVGTLPDGTPKKISMESDPSFKVEKIDGKDFIYKHLTSESQSILENALGLFREKTSTMRGEEGEPIKVKYSFLPVNELYNNKFSEKDKKIIASEEKHSFPVLSMEGGIYKKADAAEGNRYFVKLLVQDLEEKLEEGWTEEGSSKQAYGAFEGKPVTLENLKWISVPLSLNDLYTAVKQSKEIYRSTHVEPTEVDLNQQLMLQLLEQQYGKEEVPGYKKGGKLPEKKGEVREGKNKGLRKKINDYIGYIFGKKKK